jgi:DNA-binding response OmpR family regulator
MPHRVLVVEDDRDIAHLVGLHLEDLQCTVDLAHDGRSGLRQALARAYDLIILDLMLPGLEGLEICRQVRAGRYYPSILMLSARSSEMDRVLGLEMGADDYLTKPFSVRELMARVKGVFRREEAQRTSAGPEDPQIIRAGDLEIDLERHRVRLRQNQVALTAKEFDLLLQFARHPGRVYTRSQLLDLVWGNGYEGYEHTVNSHINRLRTKIEDDPGHPRYLSTVWGVGYKFADSDDWNAG